jgi:hypothetical protein
VQREPGLPAAQYRNNAAGDVFDADLASEWELARRTPGLVDLDNTEALALQAIGLDARAGRPDARQSSGPPVKSWRQRVVEFLTGE